MFTLQAEFNANLNFADPINWIWVSRFSMTMENIKAARDGHEVISSNSSSAMPQSALGMVENNTDKRNRMKDDVIEACTLLRATGWRRQALIWSVEGMKVNLGEAGPRVIKIVIDSIPWFFSRNSIKSRRRGGGERGSRGHLVENAVQHRFQPHRARASLISEEHRTASISCIPARRKTVR